jgi:tyrosine-protein phosphatase YwqE
MNHSETFIDIHCHLLPALDDGPGGWDESLAMAEMAAADGITTIVATPHQLGNYPQNSAAIILKQTARLQHLLLQRGIGIQLLPGADVRIDPDLVGKILNGTVLSLADRRRHVLLELPHEVFIPLDRLLEQLQSAGLVGILSHPERNQGIINQPNVLSKLAEKGCLFQVTAGSLLGAFGSHIQKFSETLIQQGMVDFIASDAHGTKSRTPGLKKAFDRVAELAGYELAVDLFFRNPRCVATGTPITPSGKVPVNNYDSSRKNHFFNNTRQFVNF